MQQKCGLGEEATRPPSVGASIHKVGKGAWCLLGCGTGGRRRRALRGGLVWIGPLGPLAAFYCTLGCPVVAMIHSMRDEVGYGGGGRGLEVAAVGRWQALEEAIGCFACGCLDVGGPCDIRRRREPHIPSHGRRHCTPLLRRGGGEAREGGTVGQRGRGGDQGKWPCSRCHYMPLCPALLAAFKGAGG